jgi:hypothetical protein
MQYHPTLLTADSFFSEAWLGKMLPKDPGSATWNMKTLSGITAYELTSGNRTFVLNKNANIYTETAGVSLTEKGKVASGEYIDIIRGIDWLESTITEKVFAVFVNNDKIPGTDPGVTIVENAVKEALDEGVQATLITDDYTVSVPLVSDISDQDKIDRTLPDISFTATLQGAVHTVTINGVVTV